MAQHRIFCAIAVQMEMAPLRKDIVLDAELKLFICCCLPMRGNLSYPRALRETCAKNNDKISPRYISDDEDDGNVAQTVCLEKAVI